MKDYKSKAEQVMIHTYNRYRITADHGEGVYLYDIEGRRYLDFMAGIAVCALGYGNKKYNEALKGQIDKLIHTSNMMYHAPMAEAGEKLIKASGMDRVFFTNSGAEAIEGAIKLARKYAYQKYYGNRCEIIAMKHSFHGRTMGALSVTGNPKYQEAFKPLVDGVLFAEYNNLDSVAEKISDKTCAVLLETVQGEGGIYPASEEFIRGIRKLCDDHDILMICDEIQCGMGRTGTMFAYQSYGILPDIIASAKALGCGVPVGAFAARAGVAEAMVPGDHGTTYGGNPLAAAAVSKVFDLFEEDKILEHVNRITPYLEDRLNELAEKYDVILQRRGKGLMQGLEFSIPVAGIIEKALEHGLLLISAGTRIIRFVPPLVIEEEDIDCMFGIMDSVLKSCAG